jgi:hypothetical protein
MMRSKKAIITAILLGLAIVGLIMAFRAPSEPIHEGKPLSAWLLKFSDTQERLDENETKALHTVRAMGTNALPALMRMLQARDSKFKDRTRNLLQRQKLIRIPLSFPASFQRALAYRGLWALGPAAAPAIPLLEEKLLSRDDDMNAISGVLLSIGPAAWPLFQRAMTNDQAELRVGTRVALWKATNYLERATPALAHMMANDPLQSMRVCAAITLAKTGQHEDSVVPVLLEGLQFGNDTGAEVSRAFLHYPEKAKEHINALIAVAEGPDIIASFGALDTLRRIDPAAATAAEKKRQPAKP